MTSNETPTEYAALYLLVISKTAADVTPLRRY